MIKIPFNRCVILTTLDFDRIIDRLESAIYDPRFPQTYGFGRTTRSQRYGGELHGFKFQATRIIGHKRIHIPLFLLPEVEGTIEQLHHGHEISLNVGLHNFTFMLLLTWFGGLFTFTTACIVDNVLGDIKDYHYLVDVGISLAIYLVTIAYFYFAAWRSTKFFKNLFAQRLLGTRSLRLEPQAQWEPDHQLPQIAIQRSAVDWMRANLPAFPSTPDGRTAAMKSNKMPTDRQHQDESDSWN
jgi:hypothetical protein